MSRIDAIQQYNAAYRHGVKFYNTCIAQGKSPYPPVLDDIANETQISGQQVIGIVEIPLNLVVGTLAAGRKSAFAGNFKPILPDNSEFAEKWISLAEAQLDGEGIRDPIKCIEFMGRFYVIEGNKRVSVLKSLGAAMITADVTRSVPVWSDAPEIRAYYEFMRFYKMTALYQIQFTVPGKYERLLKKLGKTWDDKFTHDEVALLRSLCLHFSDAVDQHTLERLPGMQACDVMLECLEVYTFDELLKADAGRLQKMIGAILPDMAIGQDEDADAHISTEPGIVNKSIVRQFLDDLSRPDALHIAFIYTAPPDSSDWSAAHDDGRRMLEEAFENQIVVKTYVTSRENADGVLETAVSDGAQVIFVTAPLLMGSARRIAALHPGLKVLVCALSVPYTGIRTYYARVYEAKFVLGAIAGALCKGEPIGCQRFRARRQDDLPGRANPAGVVLHGRRPVQGPDQRRRADHHQSARRAARAAGRLGPVPGAGRLPDLPGPRGLELGTDVPEDRPQHPGRRMGPGGGGTLRQLLVGHERRRDQRQAERAHSGRNGAAREHPAQRPGWRQHPPLRVPDARPGGHGEAGRGTVADADRDHAHELAQRICDGQAAHGGRGAGDVA